MSAATALPQACTHTICCRAALCWAHNMNWKGVTSHARMVVTSSSLHPCQKEVYMLDCFVLTARVCSSGAPTGPRLQVKLSSDAVSKPQVLFMRWSACHPWNAQP